MYRIVISSSGLDAPEINAVCALCTTAETAVDWTCNSVWNYSWQGAGMAVQWKLFLRSQLQAAGNGQCIQFLLDPVLAAGERTWAV